MKKSGEHKFLTTAMIDTIVGMLCFGPWYYWLPEATKSTVRDHMLRAIRAMYACQPRPIAFGEELKSPPEEAINHFIERLSVLLWLLASSNDRPVAHPMEWRERLAWIMNDSRWKTRKSLSLLVPLIPINSTTASIDDAIRFADELNVAGYSGESTTFSAWSEERYLINRSGERHTDKTDWKYLSIFNLNY